MLDMRQLIWGWIPKLSRLQPLKKEECDAFNPAGRKRRSEREKKSWLIERRVTGWQELRRSTFIRRSICDGAETTEVAEEINVLEIKMGFFFFISTSHLQEKKNLTEMILLLAV